MYCAAYYQYPTYYARLHYPGGVTPYQQGQTGGWWMTKSGTYSIEGYAYAYNIITFTWEYPTRDAFNFFVVDNDPPTPPQNLQAAPSNNGHPLLTWNNNNELDKSYYKIYKKTYEELGWFYLGSTSSNNFEDISENYVIGGQGQYYLTHNVYYKITAVDVNSNESNFSNTLTVLVEGAQIENDESEIFTGYSLTQNYPNPFNPATRISYQIPTASFIKLIVYNSLGQKVNELVNEYQEAGNYQVQFNAQVLPSGVYSYRMEAYSNDKILFSKTMRMVYIK
jgi:hypothetical protein